MTLKLDWASTAAARYAVENWHYSRSLPGGGIGLVKVGVWEDAKFIGCIIFSKGASPRLGHMFGLKSSEVCELTRVALTTHQTPVSRMIAIAFKFLRQHCPGLRAVVSFADTEQGHHGGIYAAGGWTYTGQGEPDRYYKVLGKNRHAKSIHSKYGRGAQSVKWLREHIDPKAEVVMMPGKHRYVMPLDADARQILAPLAKPYPKRAGSSDGGTPAIHAGGGGSIPTPALAIAEVSNG